MLRTLPKTRRGSISSFDKDSINLMTKPDKDSTRKLQTNTSNDKNPLQNISKLNSRYIKNIICTMTVLICVLQRNTTNRMKKRICWRVFIRSVDTIMEAEKPDNG
jgi:hypothetical protein